jgi:hypothetical protein
MPTKSHAVWLERVESDVAGIILGLGIDACPFYRQRIRHQLFDNFKRVLAAGASSWFYRDAFNQYVRKNFGCAIGTSLAHMTRSDILARYTGTGFYVTSTESRSMQRRFARALRMFSDFHGIQPIVFQPSIPRPRNLLSVLPDITVHPDLHALDIDFGSTWIWNSVMNQRLFFRDRLILGLGRSGKNYVLLGLEKDLTRTTNYVSMDSVDELTTRFPWSTADQKRKGLEKHGPFKKSGVFHEP